MLACIKLGSRGDLAVFPIPLTFCFDSYSICVSSLNLLSSVFLPVAGSLISESLSSNAFELSWSSVGSVITLSTHSPKQTLFLFMCFCFVCLVLCARIESPTQWLNWHVLVSTMTERLKSLFIHSFNYIPTTNVSMYTFLYTHIYVHCMYACLPYVSTATSTDKCRAYIYVCWEQHMNTLWSIYTTSSPVLSVSPSCSVSPEVFFWPNPLVNVS